MLKDALKKGPCLESIPTDHNWAAIPKQQPDSMHAGVYTPTMHVGQYRPKLDPSPFLPTEPTTRKKSTV